MKSGPFSIPSRGLIIPLGLGRHRHRHRGKKPLLFRRRAHSIERTLNSSARPSRILITSRAATLSIRSTEARAERSFCQLLLVYTGTYNRTCIRRETLVHRLALLSSLPAPSKSFCAGYPGENIASRPALSLHSVPNRRRSSLSFYMFNSLSFAHKLPINRACLIYN
jgi:hypothetical protein